MSNTHIRMLASFVMTLAILAGLLPSVLVALLTNLLIAIGIYYACYLLISRIVGRR